MSRTLLAIAILCAGFQYAGAQSGAGTPPAKPECEQLLELREELLKRAEAIETANKKKADATTACHLFRSYLAIEAKMISMLDSDGESCGVPEQVSQGVKASRYKTQRMGQQVCDAAKRRPFQYAPTGPYDEHELRMFKLSLRP
jgi:hypothetical protein